MSLDTTAELYTNSQLLWGVCPVMLFWTTRIWFLARRGAMKDDPVLFAITDPVSYVAGALVAGIALLAALL